MGIAKRGSEGRHLNTCQLVDGKRLRIMEKSMHVIILYVIT